MPQGECKNQNPTEGTGPERLVKGCYSTAVICDNIEYAFLYSTVKLYLQLAWYTTLSHAAPCTFTFTKYSRAVGLRSGLCSSSWTGFFVRWDMGSPVEILAYFTDHRHRQFTHILVSRASKDFYSTVIDFYVYLSVRKLGARRC